jgi:hypothetical protein
VANGRAGADARERSRAIHPPGVARGLRGDDRGQPSVLAYQEGSGQRESWRLSIGPARGQGTPATVLPESRFDGDGIAFRRPQKPVDSASIVVFLWTNRQFVTFRHRNLT